jgi:hypothetical protein
MQYCPAIQPAVSNYLFFPPVRAGASKMKISFQNENIFQIIIYANIKKNIDPGHYFKIGYTLPLCLSI